MLKRKSECVCLYVCVFLPMLRAHLQVLRFTLAVRYATCQERGNRQSISLLITYTHIHTRRHAAANGYWQIQARVKGAK